MQHRRACSHTLLHAFRLGLNETGYVEGQNVTVKYRWADSQYDRLPALAAALVRRRVSVITTGSATLAAFAAKAGTKPQRHIRQIHQVPGEREGEGSRPQQNRADTRLLG